jgi:iron complex outermembrane receptor protein
VAKQTSASTKAEYQAPVSFQIAALILTCLALIAGSNASAQALQQPAAASETGSSEPVLEEIIVSAQKRDQSILDVPVMVSVLNGHFIQDTGIVGLEDLQNYVPSLMIEANSNPFHTTIRIRGIGNLGNIPNFEPAVGLFKDGAFRSRTGMGMADLMDVERIEILHGPQSTLYGKNVTGGVVNIITKKPTRQFESMLEGTAGNINGFASQGFLNGPLGETSSGRLSFNVYSRNGVAYNDYLEDDANEVGQFSVRGQVLFEPSEDLSIRVLATHSDHGNNIKCCAPDTLYGPVLNNFSAALTGRPAQINDPFDRLISHNEHYRFTGESTEAIIDLEYHFNSMTLASLSSVDRYKLASTIDAEQSVLDISKFEDRQSGDAISQELRITSNDDSVISWLAGVYIYHNEFTRGSLDDVEPIISLGPHIEPLPLPGSSNDAAFFKGNTETRYTGIFTQGTWRVNEQLSLTGGLRWFEEDKEVSVASRVDITGPNSLAFAVTVPESQSMKRESSDWVWNLSAQFYLHQDAMTYASVSRGVKAGGFNADWGTLSIAQREFKNEEVLSFELGIKSVLLEQRVQVNATAFHSDFDNFQNASFLGVNFLIRNAEKVTSKGIEIDLKAKANDWLTLNAAATFLDAKYVRFTHGPCYFGREPDNSSDATCELDGEDLPSAPKVRLVFGSMGQWSLNSGTLYARVDWTWTDEMHTNANLDPRSYRPSSSNLNGRLGWRNDRIDFSAWIQNAADDVTALLSGPQTLFGGIDGGLQFFLNDPRIYGVTLRYRYE